MSVNDAISPSQSLTPKDQLQAIMDGHHSEPHSVLGAHPESVHGVAGIIVRCFLQDTLSVEVILLEGDRESERVAMAQADPSGFYEVFIPHSAKKGPFSYRLSVNYESTVTREFFDPYGFLPQVEEAHLKRFNEGRCLDIEDHLGAHLVVNERVPGVRFTVWAPSARRVSVVGNFNRWNGLYHPMRRMGSTGVWELFIPGFERGEPYKYEIKGPHGFCQLKSDPYATHYESPPHNASIVHDISGYSWGDDDWLKKRESTDWTREVVNIYEVHFGSWRRVVEDGNRPFSYKEMAPELTEYVKGMGFTHVEFMPLAEHPFAGSWGYQVTGFFAPTHRFGTPEDFMYLIDYLHQHGIGVIIDWVPGHFPKDAFALAEFDGTHLYEHADPRQGQHKEWGTLIFNYGRHEVRNFLLASALSWIKRFHIDGLRVDAVASMLYLNYGRKDGEWVPNKWGGQENVEAIQFLRETNDTIHEQYPGVMTIAEESTSFSGVTRSTKDHGLGFDFKWNMGWMHDSLKFIQRDPLFRGYHLNELTFGMLYQYSENFMLVYSHDEVVHMKGSMMRKMAARDMPTKSRNLRCLYTLMWCWPGKNILFMGGEFGQTAEWKYDASLDWHLLRYKDHEGVSCTIRDLNNLLRENPDFSARDNDSEAFRWVNCQDQKNAVLSFLRKGDGDRWMLVLCNFTPVTRKDYRVGVPERGNWSEVFNSDAQVYGGRNEGNGGLRIAEPIGCDGYKQSLKLTVPGLSGLVFVFE
ncbi:MAG: 1,4-alpha-glucan branching protein GlgB [Verrucomicrobiota bacterium]